MPNYSIVHSKLLLINRADRPRSVSTLVCFLPSLLFVVLEFSFINIYICFTVKKQKGNNARTAGGNNVNKNGKIKSDASVASSKTTPVPLLNGHNNSQEKEIQKNGKILPSPVAKQNGLHNHNSVEKNGDINDSEDEIVQVKKGKQKNSAPSYAAAAAKTPSPPKTTNGIFSSSFN